MNSLRNRVQLIGHLGIDPEMKTLPAGTKVAKIRIATTDTYFSNGEWKEDTQWHNLVLWEKIAERAEKQLKKGSFVLIEGKLEHRSYIDAKGENRYFTEVKVRNFVSLDKKSNSDSNIANSEAEVEEGQEDGLPF